MHILKLHLALAWFVGSEQTLLAPQGGSTDIEIEGDANGRTSIREYIIYSLVSRVLIPRCNFCHPMPQQYNSAEQIYHSLSRFIEDNSFQRALFGPHRCTCILVICDTNLNHYHHDTHMLRKEESGTLRWVDPLTRTGLAQKLYVTGVVALRGG